MPCGSLLEWAAWYERRAGTVARNVLDNGMAVSTIFLGIDYGFSRLAEPLLFETMIFYGHVIMDGPWRYPTWEAAAAHHLVLVDEWRQRTPAE